MTAKRLISKPAIWNVFKIALAIALAGFVFSRADLREPRVLLQRVSVPWVLAGALAFLAVAWFTALRYWILIDRRIKFSELLGIVILQSTLTNFVASGAGAASYVGMLRGEHQLKVSQGIKSLVLAKVGDLLAVCLALALSSWMVWAQIVPLHSFVPVLLVGITGGSALLLLLIFLPDRSLAAISRFFRKLHLNRIPMFDRGSMASLVRTVRDSQKPCVTIFPLLRYSCLILASMAAWNYYIAWGLALQVSLWSVVFVVSLTQLMAIIPIQVFGGLGVFDLTSMYLYTLFGFNQPEVAAMLIGSRIVLYSLNLLSLLYLPLAACRKRNADSLDSLGSSRCEPRPTGSSADGFYRRDGRSGQDLTTWLRNRVRMSGY